jgi:hypothetical protein
MLTGPPMEPVAFRHREIPPVELSTGGSEYEWHIAQWGLYDGDQLAGYRAYCGVQIRLTDAIVEPGRTIGSFHLECAMSGHLPAKGR